MKPKASTGKAIAPNTTAEENLHSADKRDQSALATHGQRRVNILWEITQGTIAIMLIFTVCWSSLRDIKLQPEFWMLAITVAAFYFQRTNHTKVGGVPEPRRGE